MDQPLQTLRDQLRWFPWNGSKRWLCPRLSQVFLSWDGAGRFVDPFCGGGSVSFAVRRLFPNAGHVLSDANPWLMSVFEWQATGQSYVRPDNWSDADYWRGLTDADLPNLSLHERATRFAICLLTAWGNRWKTESNGSFTPSSTPVKAAYCRPAYLGPRLEKFFAVRWLAAHDVSVACDWKRTLQAVSPGDLVYLDTPYPESLGYGNQWWSFSDQLDVVDWVADAAKRDISIVVSNMATLERLYRRAGLAVEIAEGPKANRTKLPRTEVLAWKFA